MSELGPGFAYNYCSCPDSRPADCELCAWTNHKVAVLCALSEWAERAKKNESR